jgi:hypothetical protein
MKHHHLARDAATALLESRLEKIHPDWTPSVELRPDGLFVVCRSKSGETVEWDVQYWTSVSTLRIHFYFSNQILGTKKYVDKPPSMMPAGATANANVWPQSVPLGWGPLKLRKNT